MSQRVMDGFEQKILEVDQNCKIEATGPEAAHIIALLQAESAGRLMVLPCKIGDKIYYLTGRNTVGRATSDYDRVEESIARSFMIDRDYVVLVSLNHDWKGNHGSHGVWGKTVFPTREAAEAVLRGKEEQP